jgi:hypothetical protein
VRGLAALCVVLAVVLVLLGLVGGGPREAIRAASTSPQDAGLAGAASRTPRPLAPAGTSYCSVTVSSAAAADADVQRAAGRRTVCLKGGSYEGLTLSGNHSANVTVQPVPGETVTLHARAAKNVHGEDVAVLVSPRASHITVHGFYMTAMVEIDEGADLIRIDHNDISGGAESGNSKSEQAQNGIVLESERGSVAHSPCPSCRDAEPVRNVTISGNTIHNIGGEGEADAIHVNNFQNLRVTGNDEYANYEGGSHTDCLQTVFGGTNMTFDHNYEHDNQCQGFFIKDGDVRNALVYDNLFLRDRANTAIGCAHTSACQESNIQIFDSYNVVIANNTNWSGNGDILRAPPATPPYNAVFSHNVTSMFDPGDDSAEARDVNLTDTYNIFRRAPFFFRANRRTDRIRASPPFRDPARDDFRLRGNPHGIGVDWSPGGAQFGPSPPGPPG